MYVFVYVIALAGVKFGINFTSCSGTAILFSYFIYVCICICNSTGRSEIWDKFHEL